LNRPANDVSNFHPFTPMKPLLLSACLVAAATVSASELKDPDAVLREWQHTMAQSLRVAVTDPFPLKEQSPAPARSISPERSLQNVPAWEPRKEPSPFDSVIRPRDYEPGKKPKGAKPYEFNGEMYWIIPITDRLTLDQGVDLNQLLIRAGLTPAKPDLSARRG